MWRSVPHKYFHGIHTVNSTGDYISHAKNTHSSFFVRNVEDSKFCAYLFYPNAAKDCYDWTQYGDGGELQYEILQSGEGVYRNRFGWCIWRHAKNTEYGILNVTSSDCFGCVGVRNKRFCILNKQYSESEYKSLREKIIQHMNDVPYVSNIRTSNIEPRTTIYKYGEFFPPDLSPFGYNETTAMEEFPLTEEEARNGGYAWVDREKFRGVYEITKRAEDLPDDIADADDSILGEVIGCGQCGRAFRIIKMELDFYRSQHVPLPHECYECRYRERLADRNPMRLWRRRCQCFGNAQTHADGTLTHAEFPRHSASHPRPSAGGYVNTAIHFHGEQPCPNEFETSYASERPEIVYCEQCYNAEVV